MQLEGKSPIALPISLGTCYRATCHGPFSQLSVYFQERNEQLVISNDDKPEKETSPTEIQIALRVTPLESVNCADSGAIFNHVFRIGR